MGSAVDVNKVYSYVLEAVLLFRHPSHYIFHTSFTQTFFRTQVLFVLVEAYVLHIPEIHLWCDTG